MSPTIEAPKRSMDQRMAALERANEIRTARATLKRDLKAGRSGIADLLLDPPEYVETAKVFDLLLACPKYGRVKVNKVLQLTRISPSKTVGGLSRRQRTELVTRLGHAEAVRVAKRRPERPNFVQGPDRIITAFEQRLLETIDVYGDVGPGYTGPAARALGVRSQVVTGAARRLRRDGLLDDDFALTLLGRMHLAATTSTAAIAA